MEQQRQTDAASQVFVGGTTGVDEKELHKHFEAYGSVSSVRSYSGYCRRFCLIQFKHASSAQHATLAGLQHNIAGQLVTVQPVRQQLQGTPIRQQAQHSASISKTASLSLLDILHEVPTLPELLTPDSQKALSATCKSCRLQFIAQVRVVTAVHPEDYALILERRWPRLSMVIVQGQFAHMRVSPPPNTMSFNIHVSTRDNRATISLLRPLHNPATDLPCTCSAAQQLSHQMRLRWPSITYFGMSNVHDLDGWGLGIVSQLVKGSWTHLAHLSLQGCDLKATGFLILSQGNWPRLKILDVSGNCLDAEGMAFLVRGNWPLLVSIFLSFDPTTAAVAVAHLSAANWPIRLTTILKTPFSADLAAALATLRLPNLSMLHLFSSGLTAAAVSELAQADWPRLILLNLDLHDLDAVAALLGVDQEKVQEFMSDARGLAAVSGTKILKVSGLHVGVWPKVRWIGLTIRSLQLTAQVSL